MSLEILQDPRVRAVEWQDLVPLSVWERTYEMFLSVPWLLASWWFAHIAWTAESVVPFSQWAWLEPSTWLWPLGWSAVAFACSFMLFLTGLRQVHNAYHYAIGFSRPVTEWVIYVLSATMLFSMHAVQFNHLRHHKYCLNKEDVEGMSASVPSWQALAMGPYFPYVLHVTALKLGSWRYRKWVVFELLTTAMIFYLGFFVWDGPYSAFFKFHLVAMTIGQCFTAFFAVWTVHHDCDRSHFIARTVRHPIKNFLSYNMFYHVEHHLYPKVPTCHLPKLAKRLDVAAPELCSKIVFDGCSVFRWCFIPWWS